MISNSLHSAAHPAIKQTRPITKNKTLFFKYRFMIFYRFVLAIAGGYFLSAMSATVIARLFVEDRSNAAMTATLISFCLYCCVFIWVFMVNKTWKASVGVILPSILMWSIYKYLGH